MHPNRLSNRLLDVLPAAGRERLIAASAHIDLPLATELYRRDERSRFLYLLTSGLASVVFVSDGGTSVELSTQGTEGLIGWSNLLGPKASQNDCTMQVSGTGYRVPRGAIQREFDEQPGTRARILEYAQHQHLFANQIAACNRLHRAEARFARWLLGVADRMRNDDIAMTQEFMSTMLGTRRTTVAEVCAHLARDGAIESRRGGVRIVNRAAMELHACECYRILRENFDALYRDAAAPLKDPNHRGSGVSGTRS